MTECSAGDIVGRGEAQPAFWLLYCIPQVVFFLAGHSWNEDERGGVHKRSRAQAVEVIGGGLH